MNILQIIHSFPPESMTGSEVYTYNLAKGLAKNNKVSVFYRVNDPQRPEYEIIKGRYDGLNVYKINNTLKGYRSIEKIYKNQKIEEIFSQVLDEVRPDLVHIQHLLFLSTGIVEEIKKRGIPIVFTLHDYWLVCPRGQLLKYNLKPCKEPLKANCLYCLGRALSFKNLAKRLLGFRFGRRIFKRRHFALQDIEPNVDLFIAPSEFLRRKFIEFGLPPEKIVHLDNGMDLSLFDDIKKTESDQIRFGFIGTLIPSKGAHVLLEAFRKMNGKATLKIYGHSPVNNGLFDYARKLKRMAKANNISFMGTFDNKEVARVFKDIDVLVFPSLWEENSPMILREAALSRTPVIASRIGGAEELVQDYQNGVLFEPGNKTALYEKMNFLIEHPQERQAMGCAAPVRVKHIKENCSQLKEIYERLMDAKN
ncbi:MAG: glycosyltransferase family 4 protein [Candidatus Omnitrophica bacterium]|nr:glycosyltransferase family 4 protein [Candidatus Omnitrophota bacterium]